MTPTHLSMMAGTSTPFLRLRLKRRITGLSAMIRRHRGAGACIGASVSPRTWREPASAHSKAVVRLDSSGKVLVSTGACSQGQGHETVYAQIVADALGVTPADVTIVGGDTAAIPFGVGTFASRSMVMAGNAIAEASRLVRGKLVTAAAALLEASAQDLDVDSGRVFVRGRPIAALPFPPSCRRGCPPSRGPPALIRSLLASARRPDSFRP